MSEVGLDAVRNGEAKQAEVLDTQVRTSFASGCAGVVLFSWTYRAGAEVDDWAFGITDRQRRPKPALRAAREAFADVPFRSDGEWPRISVKTVRYERDAERLTFNSLGIITDLGAMSAQIERAGDNFVSA